MIPDSKNRLEQALSDLAAYLDSAEVKGLETNEWYVQAKELLREESVAVKDKSEDDDVVEETDVSQLKEGEAF
eukprot:CAMPEP_0178812098 /NCGR_PEP_ID=MMETSP0745-20121128/19644_1 /TAXON_ID=913974 /ORGANISM="Nitzschia punctata, Strain CCMP561" /LENGTH=72 /DNA_ID=CAMNT_0020472867 /DNA_START=27 /DNA_END=245 /DNA_ORIENTATION=+